MTKMFDERDLKQIKEHGLTSGKVEEQIENFIKGFDFLPVKKAATVGDGIIVINPETKQHYINLYNSSADKQCIVKFVPASGAATRMFKSLFSYINEGELDYGIQKTISEGKSFPFYDLLNWKDNSEPKKFAQAILNYGAGLPKGLILFHNYEDGPRTAAEEHLVEAALYGESGKKAIIHFTISKEHLSAFEELFRIKRKYYERKYGTTYEISFSQQESCTDTIAVDLVNKPFREKDGSLLFRPAGHGALIENLNSIDADIIFIKNIDNVTPDYLKEDTVQYKKALAGMLLELQQNIFRFVDILSKKSNESKIELEKIEQFIGNELNCILPEDYSLKDIDAKCKFLLELLDRPLRICGMVKNEGEAGGGPFWVENKNGTVSLNIAEASQISPELMHLLEKGTHFNPVDLVCGVRNYKGEKFDLKRYTDPSTGFISEKSKDGRPLKAQELPGLWNGAMADWITVFVEVPGSTFTPVKELNDLLRPEHR